MKILFVAAEGAPYSKTGGLADVVEALPKALVAAGHEVCVFLPRYRGNKIVSTLISSVTIPMGGHLRFPAIAEAQPVDRVRFFFADDPDYFDRDGLYGDKKAQFPDNAERFAELARTAIEFTKRVWLPDVVHCHDWQTALVPVLLRTQHSKDPAVRSLPVVFTIHNLAYQGLFPAEVMEEIGLPRELFGMDGLEFYGKVNFLKGGIEFADFLTTVSRTYAREIQTPEFGAGLEGVIRNRADRLVGILNGVDYSIWSPESDRFIAQNYSVHNLDGKKACKKNLLEVLDLPAANIEKPLIGIVSRFADQKGFDLIAEIADELMQEDVMLAVLGMGEAKYEEMFTHLAVKYPARVGLKIAFDEKLAHKIEAGADMFLMPSRFEPCGLSQIYSLRYGTVPIVRATGGLEDTVDDYNPKTKQGTGFKFDPYDGRVMIDRLRAALKTYRETPTWRSIMTQGMSKDFSWKSSATAYVELYERARRLRIPKPVATSKRNASEGPGPKASH
jgi:starch synthase